MRKLDFPDLNYREPGRMIRQTVQAMRDAEGDRKVAAKALGITRHALASRLHTIRGMQDAAK